MPAYLDKIVLAHRASAAADPRHEDTLVAEARRCAADRAAGGGPGIRSFSDSLRHGQERRGIAVIAEIKKRSPSKGLLAPDLDPEAVAQEYEAGGASCLSVLTDGEFFGGSPTDLRVARAACSLPVLRKDFTVGVADLCDATLMGADAILLIVAALDDAELVTLIALSRDLLLDPLVEVHDEAELERALAAGADVIGVNQRDLRTFDVDRARALRLAAMMPEGVVSVAESGIANGHDVAVLAEAGFTAVLVGETLVRASDRRVAVDELLSGRA